MLEKAKLGNGQFIILVMLFTVGDPILIIPSIVANEAGKDAWISALISITLAIPIIYLFTYLQKGFPNLTMVEICEKVLGKWLGKILAFFFIFGFLCLLAASLLREVGDFMLTQILPNTPIQVVLMLFLVIVIRGVRSGLQTIGRAAELFVPWVFALILLLLVFITPDIELNRIQPILDDGIQPVIRGTYTFLAIPFMEVAAFFMIFPYVQDKAKIKKHFMIGTLMGGLILVIIIFLCILVLGEIVTSTSMYPSYSLAKKIELGEFIQRIEVIMAVIWLFTIFFKLTVCFYGISIGSAQMLKLEDYRPLTFPLGMILLALAIIISPNISYYNNVTAHYYPLFDFTFSIGLALLLLIVAFIRNKAGAKL